MKKRILLSMMLGVFVTLFMANVSSAVQFGSVVNLGSTVNTNNNERFPDISSDDLDLYLSSDIGGDNDIFLSTRPDTGSSFGLPSNMGGTINSPDFDNGPSITSNNQALFFSSNRTGGFGNIDIWVSVLPGAPGNVGPVVNSTANDVAPDIDSTGLFMFFHSDRTGGSGGNDLYVAKRDVIGPWDTVGNLVAVNSGSADVAPTISSDGLTLYFSSNRSGGFGGFDLYVSIRPDTTSFFGAAVNLGSLINSSFDDMAPSISSDGSILYFDSNRDGGYGGFDIYQSTVVPEPATIALLGIGLVGLAGAAARRRRKMKAKS